MAVVLLVASYAIKGANANTYLSPKQQYLYSDYSYPGEVVELHIVKNDGMNSHEVYTCKDMLTCYTLYQSKRNQAKNNSCNPKMYLKRANGNIMRLR
ncbi:hypothetical protein CRYPA_950 [uncultured Candidatus Thioglobus sp.]|nr:hypothetical protein CRYPA_950 [uncultured Candidatus Thioglobus sp.]